MIFRRHFPLFVTALIVVCSTVQAADIAWVPVSSDGAHTIVGDEIILQGGGQIVRMDIMVSGWDPNMDGNPVVGSVQASFDAASFTTGSGAALSAFANPDASAGAFHIKKICTVNQLLDPDGQRCDVSSCPAGEFCVDNPALIVSGLDPLCTVATLTDNYEYSCTTGPGGGNGVTDTGTPRYAGTLLIVVPATAAGTYTISFDPNPQITFLLDFSGLGITPVTLTSGKISIACQTNLDCDDGNACTTDVCNASNRCVNTDNFNTNVDCCNPTTGQLTPLDNGNNCTNGVCDPSTGVVAQEPLPTGTLCGNPALSECDRQDTCDANGFCINRIAIVGSSCGNINPTECSDPDTCTITGACARNDKSAGTPCGSAVNDQCSAPDSCNGFGNCNVNHVPNGTACNDALFCTSGEVCTTGTCGNGSATCNDGVACTDDSCNEVESTCTNLPNDVLCNNLQFCDGVEICDSGLGCVVSPNSVPNCNDLVSCTVDTCDEVNDQCVNTTDDTRCNNGQFCDGIEICDAVSNCIIQNGTVPNCDDGIVCTVDQCNESIDQCDNIADDSFCADDGLFCTGIEICDPLIGCRSSGCPCGEPCTITCDEAADICLCDAPVVMDTTPRYLIVSLRPPDSQIPQAIAVRAKCAVGVMRFAGPPVPIDINSDGIDDGVLSFLVDAIADAAFLTPAQWGDTVFITGEGVVPGTFYDVAVDCGTVGAPALSSFSLAITDRWGDVTGNGLINTEDILQTVKAFQRDFTNVNLAMADSDGCVPNQLITTGDILDAVLTFQLSQYDLDTNCMTDCPLCHPAECNDNDACTDDACDLDTGVCLHIPNFDDAMFCCAPDTRALTPIDDGNLCTIDTCNASTGGVVHALIDCEDNNDCTVDRCIAGFCDNTSFDTIACSDNGDCPASSAGCDLNNAGGRCTCPGAPAALIEWQPVSSTGPFTIVGNEIFIPNGGVEVTVDVFISNWAPDELLAYQFSILGNESYTSGQSGVLSPVSVPNLDTGAFIITDRCTVNEMISAEGAPCGFTGMTIACAGGQFCVPNPDFMFADDPDILSIVNTSNVDYAWASITQSSTLIADPGIRKYAGTLVLEVSADAAGTFTLQFKVGADSTILFSSLTVQTGNITPITMRPGLITVGN